MHLVTTVYRRGQYTRTQVGLGVRVAFKFGLSEYIRISFLSGVPEIKGFLSDPIVMSIVYTLHKKWYTYHPVHLRSLQVVQYHQNVLEEEGLSCRSGKRSPVKLYLQSPSHQLENHLSRKAAIDLASRNVLKRTNCKCLLMTGSGL